MKNEEVSEQEDSDVDEEEDAESDSGVDGKEEKAGTTKRSENEALFNYTSRHRDAQANLIFSNLRRQFPKKTKNDLDLTAKNR